MGDDSYSAYGTRDGKEPPASFRITERELIVLRGTQQSHRIAFAVGEEICISECTAAACKPIQCDRKRAFDAVRSLAREALADDQIIARVRRM